MSHSDAPTPDDRAPAKSPVPAPRIEYMRSLYYVFENPNWLTNVLLVGLCMLSALVIPVVGQLVAQGYQYSIIEALYLQPGSRYPDFDTNKLVDYLLRGFWVFLVSLALWLAMLPVLAGFVGMFVAVIYAVGASGGDDGYALAITVGGPILAFTLLVLGIATNVIFVPFMLRAGLTQDFVAAFDFGFAKQFIANTWKSIILCTLFSLAAGLLLAFAGLAIFCVGVLFTTSIAIFLHTHLTLQLYRLHLARGGDVIALPANAPPQQTTG